VEIIKDLMSVPIEVKTTLPKAQIEEQAFTKIDIPDCPVLIGGYTGCGKSTFITEFLQRKTLLLSTVVWKTSIFI
jgi:predicted GTPase